MHRFSGGLRRTGSAGGLGKPAGTVEQEVRSNHPRKVGLAVVLVFGSIPVIEAGKTAPAHDTESAVAEPDWRDPTLQGDLTRNCSRPSDQDAALDTARLARYHRQTIVGNQLPD